MDTREMDPKIKHGIFSWDIENFLLCLTERNYTIESSTFVLAGCSWFLKLRVEQSPSRMCFIVQLCRGVDDNSRRIVTRYSISLNSGPNVLYSTESEYVFEKGDVVQVIDFHTTWQDFWVVYGNDHDDDVLSIECDMFSMKYHSKSSINDGKLSEDLMTLLDAEGSHNVVFITEDVDLPAHKEILSAYSPAFEAYFGVGNVSLPVQYDATIVQAVLKFLYSGKIEQALVDGSPPPIGLHKFAEQYQIFALVKYLSPWRMSAVSKVKCQVIKFGFDYPYLFSRNNPHLRRKISDDTEVAIYFVFNEADDTMSVKIKLTRSRLMKPASVSGLFYILNSEGSVRFRRHVISKLDSNDDCTFNFDLSREQLVIMNVIIPPCDVIKMLCEFKLGYPTEEEGRSSESTDVEYNVHHQDYLVEELRCSLTGCMEYLFLYAVFFDLQLFSMTEESYPLCVHRSVLSARSPTFNRLLQDKTITTVPIKFSTEVIRQLVFYIYTGRLSDDCTNFSVLYKAAEEYEVTPLKDKCREEIYKSMNKSVPTRKHAPQNEAAALKYQKENSDLKNSKYIPDSPTSSTGKKAGKKTAKKKVVSSCCH